MGDPFDVLTADLFRAVLLRCDNAALVRAGCVSQRWRSISREGTVLAIYKNQRVLYINGRSRWDWDCVLYNMLQVERKAESPFTPDITFNSTRRPQQSDGVNSSSQRGCTGAHDTATFLVETVLNDAPQKGSFRHLDFSHMPCEGPLSLAAHRNLEFVAIPPTCLSLSAKGCSLLKRIQVGRTGFQSQGPTPGLQSSTQIDLSGCRVISVDSFERLFPGTGDFDSLSVLLLRYCQLLTDDALAAVVRRCPNLKKLGLTGIAGPATLAALATVSDSRLEILDLAHSPKIGDADVLPLLTACPRLRRCNLRGCKGVSGAAYNAVAKELYSRLAADGVPVPSEFFYLKR